MEVTLRLVVATMLMLTMALLAGSLANSQSSDADNFSDSQTNYANCQLWKSRSDTIGDPSSDQWETRYDDNNCGSGGGQTTNNPTTNNPQNPPAQQQP